MGYRTLFRTPKDDTIKIKEVNFELHVRIKLLLPVLFTVLLAHECPQTNDALARLSLVVGLLAELLDEARFLDLRLEALLKTVVAFFAVPVCVDTHSSGSVREVLGYCKEKRGERTRNSLRVTRYALLVTRYEFTRIHA